jgi:hypothetical protein
MTGIVEEWRVREYEKNVYTLAQQKDMRMAMHAIWGTQHSKMKSYDRVGSADWIQRVGRYGDTPNLEVDHSRRNVIMTDWEWGKLVDDTDLLRTINDPTNPYAMAAAMGAKRKFDMIFRDAALGTALTGEDGTGTQALPNAQHIAAVDSGALSSMNIDALRLASYLFNAADIDPEETRYMAINAFQLRKMLTETEMINADYANVKALVDGKIDTFMGFKFIRTELLDTETTAMTYDVNTGLYNAAGTSGINGTRCIAWVKSGMRMSIGKDVTSDISKRKDKRNIPQIYNTMTLGAVRMEDVKVIEINAKAS